MNSQGRDTSAAQGSGTKSSACLKYLF